MGRFGSEWKGETEQDGVIEREGRGKRKKAAGNLSIYLYIYLGGAVSGRREGEGNVGQKGKYRRLGGDRSMER